MVVQVPPVIEPSPLSDGVTVTPAAAAQPVPSFFETVTVNVCASPTLFVPDCAIEIRASTQVLVLETVKAP